MSRRIIFVDTVAWIALINADDFLHQQALQLMHELGKQNASLLTTGFVLLEVADALSALKIRKKAVQFLDGLKSLTILTILDIEQDWMDKGWGIYSQRDDKSWGLTDCISFAVMDENKVHEAFTSDEHFKQAGYTRLINQWAGNSAIHELLNE